MRDHREPLETSSIGSKVPSGGSLRQTSIRELLHQEQPTFKNPADRPTMLDQADHGSDWDTLDNPRDHGSMTKHRQTLGDTINRAPTIRSLGGRSPCGNVEPITNITPGDDDHIVDKGEKLNNGVMMTDSMPSNMKDDTSNDDLSGCMKDDLSGSVKGDDLRRSDEVTMTTPSSIGQANQLLSMGRGSECNTSMNGRDGAVTVDDQNTNSNGNLPDCTFKRGGRCNLHGLKGEKSTHTEKYWGKRRDGTFAWLFRKTVKYECKFGKSIPASDSGSRSPNLDRSKCGIGNHANFGSSQISNWISGSGIRRGSASFESESGLRLETGEEKLSGPTD